MSGSALFVSAFLGSTLNPNAAAPIPQRQMLMNYEVPAKPALRMEMNYAAAPLTRTLRMDYDAPPAGFLQTLMMDYTAPAPIAEVMSMDYAGKPAAAAVMSMDYTAPVQLQQTMLMQYGPNPVYSAGPPIPGRYQVFGPPTPGAYFIAPPGLPGRFEVNQAFPGAYEVTTDLLPGSYAIYSLSEPGEYLIGDDIISLPVEMVMDYEQYVAPLPPGGVGAGQTMGMNYADEFYFSVAEPRTPQMSMDYETQTYFTAPPGAVKMVLPSPPAFYIATVIPGISDDSRIGHAVIGEAVIQ